MANKKQLFKGSDWRFIAKEGEPVTLSDTVIQPVHKGIYIGTAGTLVARYINSEVDVTFLNLPAGTFMPFSFEFLKITGSTVTGLIWYK